jgi:hypothetical protein
MVSTAVKSVVCPGVRWLPGGCTVVNSEPLPGRESVPEPGGESGRDVVGDLGVICLVFPVMISAVKSTGSA